MTVDGELRRALVDTGCSRSIIADKGGSHSNNSCMRRQEKVIMMNGDVAVCETSRFVQMVVNERQISLDCLVSRLVPGYDMLLGMDAINQLGGVYVSDGGRSVRFGSLEFPVCGVSGSTRATDEEGHCFSDASSITINDQDFSAIFTQGKWVVKYNWRQENQDPVLRNQVTQYRVREECKKEYEDEVEEWIAQGWLQEYVGEKCGIIPLLAVVQPNKGKTRPVLDFRELNQFVSSHTAASDVCGEKLRSWRRMGTNVCLIDLRKAYLQLHVAPDMWKYQVVMYKGKRYCLTRLGFGLNVAPKIMTAVLREVLKSDPMVHAGTDSYIDDIIVNQNIVDADRVNEVLNKFGLIAKDPESIVDGRILGLKVFKDNHGLKWKRDNQIIDIANGDLPVTRRHIFSWCGQLLGHYPVAGWLRPACGFLKRLTNGYQWDEEIATASPIMAKIREIMATMTQRDPVGGKWEVTNMTTGRVWCDASSLAIGVCLEIDDTIVEDNSWLRKEGDMAHINLAELESVIKGINLCIMWRLTTVEVMSDSATVCKWIQSIITGDKKVKVHGLSEMLVKRRLLLLQELIENYELKVSINYIKSCQNKSDQLTRVPKHWLIERSSCGIASLSKLDTTPNQITDEQIRQAHSDHHFGVQRTMYLLKRCYPTQDINEQRVIDEIRNCSKCQSIDPAPVRWQSGGLQVRHNWRRLAVDVTHYHGSLYLTMVDCGPSRFSIWRKIPNESAGVIVTELEEIFRERGPPDELLLDNALSFKSNALQMLCKKWSVYLKYRCAYRAGGNAIVERNHRTIKRMAARTGADVRDMAFYYNLSPCVEADQKSVPSRSVFSYEWRHPRRWRCVIDSRCANKLDNQYRVGMRVFVKPGSARCTTPWPSGVVTQVRDSLTVEVDGVPRHVADVRRAPLAINDTMREAGGENADDEHQIVNTRTSNRVRRPPVWIKDYCMDSSDISTDLDDNGDGDGDLDDLDGDGDSGGGDGYDSDIMRAYEHLEELFV